MSDYRRKLQLEAKSRHLKANGTTAELERLLAQDKVDQSIKKPSPQTIRAKLSPKITEVDRILYQYLLGSTLSEEEEDKLFDYLDFDKLPTDNAISRLYAVGLLSKGSPVYTIIDTTVLDQQVQGWMINNTRFFHSLKNALQSLLNKPFDDIVMNRAIIRFNQEIRNNNKKYFYNTAYIKDTVEPIKYEDDG